MIIFMWGKRDDFKATPTAHISNYKEFQPFVNDNCYIMPFEMIEKVTHTNFSLMYICINKLKTFFYQEF